MKTKRTLTIATVLVALATFTTLGVFRGTRGVQAQDVSPPIGDRISFGMVGITQGQTIRLSVANISDAVCPCNRVVLTFLDTDGRRFRNRDGSFIRKVVQLEPGRATFLDLNYDELPPGPVRLQLRAIVTVIPPPVGEQPPPVHDRIVTTVEVINNANGRTAFALFAPPSVQRLQAPPIGD